MGTLESGLDGHRSRVRRTTLGRRLRGGSWMVDRSGRVVEAAGLSPVLWAHLVDRRTERHWIGRARLDSHTDRERNPPCLAIRWRGDHGLLVFRKALEVEVGTNFDRAVCLRRGNVGDEMRRSSAVRCAYRRDCASSFRCGLDSSARIRLYRCGTWSCQIQDVVRMIQVVREAVQTIVRDCNTLMRNW